MVSQHSKRVALTVVFVIAVLVPVLGTSVAHPVDRNTTPKDDTSVRENHRSDDCRLSVRSAVVADGKADIDTTSVATPSNASERDERSFSVDSGDETIKETLQFLLPCQNVTGRETDDGTLLRLEQITTATLGTLNRTGSGVTTVVDTGEHSVVEIVNGTVAVVRSTIGTEQPPTPTESDEKAPGEPEVERTEPPPIERTTSTDTRQRSVSPTPVEEVTPTAPPTTSSPTATTTPEPTTRSTTTETTTPEPTTADRSPDRETLTAVSLSVPVRSSSNDSDDGSNPPSGKGLPFEPERETGAAVGLGATVVRMLFTHGSTASETISRPHDVGSIHIRHTTVIDSLSRVMVLLRYSRYDDSDPLEHDGRAIVFEAIEETPGIYLSAISDHTEYSLSTLRHHLRVLEREGLIMSVKVHGKRRFYPVDTEWIELTAALGEEATANVIEALCHLGPATVSELADELDRDPSTVTHHLQRLDDDEIVRRQRSGRVVMNRLSDDVVTYLTERPERLPIASSAD
ncbi:winged helix-turn-helix transcriptional regulator [Halocatena salina]|uniref:ArsR family transcriptional regulator n=1 Tax=Halocatena salina TaxID=2934340 RepID=A0A8U0A7P5_9EURY|nr:helix-turn-helix domain-containing protein [Halocatena salina]UPM44033.1 ArsR family transcriptional regulator [Halocatena salina]